MNSKKEYTEKHTIISFLKEIHNKKFISFPFKLIHRDKPDLLIEFQSKKIGVEITQSIPEQLARAWALLKELFPKGGTLEPEFFGWNAPNRTNDEIIKILLKSNKRLVGEGSYGKSVEAKWVNGIMGCLTAKTEKLNNVGFDKYQKNWLVIYDKQSKIFLDKEYVKAKMTSYLIEYFNSNSKVKFDNVFIYSGNFFYIIENSKSTLISIIKNNSTRI